MYFLLGTFVWVRGKTSVSSYKYLILRNLAVLGVAVDKKAIEANAE